MAGLDGGLHVRLLPQTEIIDGHNRVDPIELCGGGKELRHIRVGAEAEETNELSLLGFDGPFAHFIGQLLRLGRGVNAVVQVNVIGVHSLQRELEALLHFRYVFRVGGLRGDEELVSDARVLFEKFAYADLAVSAGVVVGGVPVGGA
jgi:hypothetical protein